MPRPRRRFNPHRIIHNIKFWAIEIAVLLVFLKWLGGLDLTPTIKDIRYSIERLRDVEMGRHRGWLAQLEPAERERVELLTRGLTNKLLHRILSGLKQRDDKTLDAAFAAEVARRLLGAEFDAQDAELDDEDHPDADDDDSESE